MIFYFKDTLLNNEEFESKFFENNIIYEIMKKFYLKQSLIT